jgi:lipoate-protein ligase A
MNENSVLLVRRQSGGGTVYHDEHNTNFSFIADKKIHDKNFNHSIITRALGALSVEAVSTQRGDIRLKEFSSRKVSGSAFKEKKDSAFHHGTMLINSDLDSLNIYINSDKQKLVSKSISSIRSIVANINEINTLVTSSHFTKAISSEFDPDKVKITRYVDSTSELYKDIVSSDYYKHLTSNEWRYFETPLFEVDVNLGWINIQMSIKKTKIVSIDVDSNNIHASLSQLIEETLLGVSLFDIKNILQSVDLTFDNTDKKLLSWFNDYFCLENLP